MAIQGLSPSAPLLLGGLFLDAIFGDPEYALHPIRLMGRTLIAYETLLRRIGWDAYGGGCGLFFLLFLTWTVIPSLLLYQLTAWNASIGLAAHAVLVYMLFALRDLIDHVRIVQRAANRGDLAATREAIGRLVGRDTSMMDLEGCRRAAIESLSENFVDGFLSALFWYVLLGLPGLLLFKVASTMDSMVGYKTPRYLRFGWCGARLDDLMNYLPARIGWALIGLSGFFSSTLSTRKAWRIGWNQHQILPGPNPGWSEATMAGLLQRRLIGPIWKNGEKVTEVWIGELSDPAGGTAEDLQNAIRATLVSSAAAVLISVMVLLP